jgi:hypothetical protein
MALNNIKGQELKEFDQFFLAIDNSSLPPHEKEKIKSSARKYGLGLGSLTGINSISHIKYPSSSHILDA